MVGAWVGFLYKIHIVNIARRVKLRHEQRIHLPELGFDKCSSHLLKPHADQLQLEEVEKLTVGCRFPAAILGARKLIVYFRNRLFARPFLEKLRRHLRDFFRHAIAQQALGPKTCPSGVSTNERVTRSSILNGSRAFPRFTACCWSTFRSGSANVCSSLAPLPLFLQRWPHRLCGGLGRPVLSTHPPCTIRTAPSFLAPHRLAHIRRFEAFLGLNILDREAFSVWPASLAADGRVQWGNTSRNKFADRRQRGEVRNRFSMDGNQRFRPAAIRRPCSAGKVLTRWTR